MNSTDSVHLIFGNPSNAVTDVNEQDNYLLVKDQYALSYNNSLQISNWASWQLNADWLATAARQNDFRPDLSLPDDWYQVDANDYRGSGFDRGHLVPSADRTASIEDNSATFLMTNIIPQAPDNNQNAWGNLEAFSRDLVIGEPGNFTDDKELYIVAGSYGVGGVGSQGDLDAIVTPDGEITVPQRTWKAILVLDNPGDGVEDVTVDSRIIAVDIPNEQDISNDWQDFLVSVDDIEAATDLDLFSNLPDDIEAVIEAQVDQTGWIINEIHADPDSSQGDANGDGIISASQDEFVELVNNTGEDVDISGWTLVDRIDVRHTFDTGTIIPDQEAIVVFGGGTPTGSFGDATVQVASLGLNNAGDTITLKEGSVDVATVTYGSEGGKNQSLTRDRDLTGNLTLHSTATDSGGTLFSPGTQIDGTSWRNFSSNIIDGSSNLEDLSGTFSDDVF
ncbi:MAG: DNA/RNA non-specific endonuclease [Cyanobacteria bacterium P01_A01_bin.83]